MMACGSCDTEGGDHLFLHPVYAGKHPTGREGYGVSGRYVAILLTRRELVG